jgi:hypothetical protein
MGNSFPGLFCRFTAPRPGRRKAAHAVVASLEETEFDIGETNQPMAVFGFGHANGFPISAWLTKPVVSFHGIGKVPLTDY